MPRSPTKKPEFQTLSFATSCDWAVWLAGNHAQSQGLWLRFFKKNSGVESVTYSEALDEALCYGWIDGQLKKCDEKSYLQKFTPRRSRSLWSKRNVANAERLIQAARMKPAGLKEIEAAKSDGRWQNAYDPPGAIRPPADFLKRVAKNKKAAAFLKTLNKANTYAICWRLQTAKRPETRERRMTSIIQKLEKGEKWH